MRKDQFMVNRSNVVQKSSILFVLHGYPKGMRIPIGEIMEDIQTELYLSPEDWMPHTVSRPTTYPVWRDRVQNTLHEMKEKGEVIHDSVNHTYIFLQ